MYQYLLEWKSPLDLSLGCTPRTYWELQIFGALVFFMELFWDADMIFHWSEQKLVRFCWGVNLFVVGQIFYEFSLDSTPVFSDAPRLGQ